MWGGFVLAENNLNGIIIAHGEGFAKSRCKQQLVDSGIQCVLVSAIEALENLSATLFIVDGDLIGKLPDDWQSSLDKPIMVGAEEHLDIDADFYLPRDFSYRAAMKNIEVGLVVCLVLFI